ncbi:GATA-type zinc finger protein 1 [Mactra antiquata]
MQDPRRDIVDIGHVDLGLAVRNGDRSLESIRVDLDDDYKVRDVSTCVNNCKIYKSSKTVDVGNDSGFVETFHTNGPDEHIDWRKDCISLETLCSRPNVCSTPIRESFYAPPIDFSRGVSSKKQSQFNPVQVSPISYKTGANTADNDNHVTYGQEALCDTKSGLLQGKPIDLQQKPNLSTSDISRGHRTISSILKSLPLNIAQPTSCFTISTRNIEHESESPRVIHKIDTNKHILVPKRLEINPSIVHTENSLKTCHCITEEYSSLHGYCKQRLFAPTVHYSDISDGDDTEHVDENNNATRIVPKYSDISDACASDTGSVVESSCSEEDATSTANDENKPALHVPKRSRKLSIPKRSALKVDPTFRGATLWLQTSFQNGASVLNMSAFYSNVNTQRPTKRKLKRHNLWSLKGRWASSRYLSCSDPEDKVTSHYVKDNSIVKTCASCKTRRTPLWRDAEDGTPLCNACGIRYKKYRLRCSKCWLIPKKDVSTYPNCPVCGGSLRYSSHKKQW